LSRQPTEFTAPPPAWAMEQGDKGTWPAARQGPVIAE
jgi:hypothetical protein